MIELHRIGHAAAAFHLNPDLILSVEAHPDTVVTLTTGDRFLVAESDEEVCARVNRWRSAVLRDALGPTRPGSPRDVVVSVDDRRPG